MSATAAQIAANQANAKLSTGPATAEGKQRSAANATTHGATSKKALMPWESLEEYQAFSESVFRDYRPANDHEKLLAKVVVDTTWRYQRILAAEDLVMAAGPEPGAARKRKPARRGKHRTNSPAVPAPVRAEEPQPHAPLPPRRRARNVQSQSRTRAHPETPLPDRNRASRRRSIRSAAKRCAWPNRPAADTPATDISRPRTQPRRKHTHDSQERKEEPSKERSVKPTGKQTALQRQSHRRKLASFRQPTRRSKKQPPDSNLSAFITSSAAESFQQLS